MYEHEQQAEELRLMRLGVCVCVRVCASMLSVASCICLVSWSVGLMDKVSASGAGDSRFESWADHCTHVDACSARVTVRVVAMDGREGMTMGSAETTA